MAIEHGINQCIEALKDFGAEGKHLAALMAFGAFDVKYMGENSTHIHVFPPGHTGSIYSGVYICFGGAGIFNSHGKPFTRFNAAAFLKTYEQRAALR